MQKRKDISKAHFEGSQELSPRSNMPIYLEDQARTHVTSPPVRNGANHEARNATCRLFLTGHDLIYIEALLVAWFHTDYDRTHCFGRLGAGWVNVGQNPASAGWLGWSALSCTALLPASVVSPAG